MVYLAIKNGAVIHHANEAAMRRLDGVTPDLIISDAEFEAANGLIRVINGAIAIGETPAERNAEKRERERAAIRAELDDIDRQSARAARAVALAHATGKTANADDVVILVNFEEKARKLRETLLFERH